MSVTRPEVAVELREAVQAFAAAQRRLRGRDAKAGGLSFAQFHLLRTLAEVDECPASKLAAEADLTPASVTQALDHLAEVGLRRQAGGVRAALEGRAGRPLGRATRPGRAGAAADGRGPRRDLVLRPALFALRSANSITEGSEGPRRSGRSRLRAGTGTPSPRRCRSARAAPQAPSGRGGEPYPATRWAPPRGRPRAGCTPGPGRARRARR
jgi:hypothetical protein